MSGLRCEGKYLRKLHSMERSPGFFEELGRSPNHLLEEATIPLDTFPMVPTLRLGNPSRGSGLRPLGPEQSPKQPIHLA